MKLKRIVSLLATGLIIVGSLNAPRFLLANNYRDSYYKYDFNVVKTNSTPMREKLDNSSSYMSCKKVSVHNAKYSAHATGCYKPTSTVYDCSKGHEYTFTEGTTHFLVNWVYEKSQTFGMIEGKPIYPPHFVADGVWSPDSI